MASASNVAPYQEPVLQRDQAFKKKKGPSICTLRLWMCWPFAFAAFILMIWSSGPGLPARYCVLYINGTQNATYKVPGNSRNCSKVQLKDESLTGQEVRIEEVYDYSTQKNYQIALIVFLMILILFFVPPVPGNYVSCWRRTTCCFMPVSLKDAINRYMTGYISDEDHFQEVVQFGEESLYLIIEKLKRYITEVTFDVLKTGSLVERLGKPSILQLRDFEKYPIKSVLSTDIDVMLYPQTAMATAIDELNTSQPQKVLFHAVTFQNITPGFVWLKLNKDCEESENMFWRNLCIEFTFPDGSKGIYLSSLEVRNVFVEGMKRIKRKEAGSLDILKKLGNLGVSFSIKAQGPAVTVEVESRESMCAKCIKCGGRPILFYGDFIFAIRCIGWPQEAREWPMRKRFWPPPAVIEEVKMSGYHVVPKPSHPTPEISKKKRGFRFTNKKTKKQDKNHSVLECEWRLSYSLAEVLLSRHIPPVARACLIALKATIKRHKDSGGYGLTSYHLKTVLFWALEMNPPDFWSEERIEECFKKLVDILLGCVENQHCSHYFMPQANLMHFPQLQFYNIKMLLSKIKENPVSYVSSTGLRCKANVAACYECICFWHGKDVYMDVY